MEASYPKVPHIGEAFRLQQPFFIFCQKRGKFLAVRFLNENAYNCYTKIKHKSKNLFVMSIKYSGVKMLLHNDKSII